MDNTVRSRSEWLVFSGKDEDSPVWVDRFEAYMRLKKKYAALTGTVFLADKPGEIDQDTASAPEKNTYVRDLVAYEKAVVDFEEEKVLVWCELVQFLDKESLIMLRHDCKNDGPKAWKELNARYKSAAKPRVMTLMTQLTSLKLGPSESMESYLSRAREISYNLDEVKEPVSDSMLTSLVLRGLSDKYTSFVTVQNFSTADFAETRRKLQSFADNMESQKEFDSGSGHPVAMFGQGARGGQRGGRGWQRGVRGFSRGGKAVGGNSSEGFQREFKGRCFKCNKFGHKKPECPENEKIGLHAFGWHASTEDSVALSSSSSGKECLVMDSGCTEHMLRSKDLFVEYTPCEGVSNNANGSQSTVAGRGIAEISTRTESGEELVLELSALHVPDYTKNLLSAKAATANSHSVSFTPTGGCIALKGGAKLPLVEKQRLYMLECGPAQRTQCNLLLLLLLKEFITL